MKQNIGQKTSSTELNTSYTAAHHFNQDSNATSLVKTSQNYQQLINQQVKRSLSRDNSATQNPVNSNNQEQSLTVVFQRQHRSHSNKPVNRSSRHRKRQQFERTHSHSVESGASNSNNNAKSGSVNRNNSDAYNEYEGAVAVGPEVNTDTDGEEKPVEFSAEIIEAADKVTYITNHIKSENDYEEVLVHFYIKSFDETSFLNQF